MRVFVVVGIPILYATVTVRLVHDFLSSFFCQFFHQNNLEIVEGEREGESGPEYGNHNRDTAAPVNRYSVIYIYIYMNKMFSEWVIGRMESMVMVLHPAWRAGPSLVCAGFVYVQFAASKNIPPLEWLCCFMRTSIVRTNCSVHSTSACYFPFLFC